MKFLTLLKFVFNRVFFQKLVALLLFLLAFWALRDFAAFFLKTFLFAYLFHGAGKFLSERGKDAVTRVRAPWLRSLLSPLTSLWFLVLLCYLLLVGLFVFAVSDLVPRVMQELSDLPKYFPFVREQVEAVQAQLKEVWAARQDLGAFLEKVVTEQNYERVVSLLGNLKIFGSAVVQVLMSLVLSYVFIVDWDRITGYFEGIKKGNLAFLYREYANIFGKIGHAFGMIFKAQAVISLVNTGLTGIGLFALGQVYGHLAEGKGSFPYLFTLCIVVFILGFVPVLGYLISSVPLLVVGFTYGGVNMVLAIAALVAVVHAVEAYFLNPRIVSSYAEIPMSLSFLILFLSEHAFGILGLLIGVPLFYLAVDLLKDFDEYVGGLKVTYGHMQDRRARESAAHQNQ